MWFSSIMILLQCFRNEWWRQKLSMSRIPFPVSFLVIYLDFFPVSHNFKSCSHQNSECANSNRENPPNRIINRFFELNSAEIRCRLNPKAQAVNKAQRQIKPEPYFPKIFKSRAQYLYLVIYLDFLKTNIFSIFVSLLQWLNDVCSTPAGTMKEIVRILPFWKTTPSSSVLPSYSI